MGSIETMITMLRNNELIKKKTLHFKDKSKAKYLISKLTFKKGSKEDIERIRIKIRKQQRRILIKKLIILLISIAVVSIIFIYIKHNLE